MYEFFCAVVIMNVIGLTADLFMMVRIREGNVGSLQRPRSMSLQKTELNSGNNKYFLKTLKD